MEKESTPLPEETPTETVKLLAPTALEAIERAEIDVAIATAKRYPRDLAQVKTNMRQMATKDPDIAASCSYALPRAGKEITGASVRLAEIAVSCYGNISVAVRVVQTGDDTVTSQAVAHDLEKNVRIGLEIPRNVQVSKNARNPEAALRDAKHIAALACNAIAFREAAFKVIPRSLVNPILEEARAVAAGKGRSFDEARETCLAKFIEIGVSRKKIYEYLGIGGIEAMTTTHLQLLFGVLTAIQEGDTNVEAEFGPRDKMPKDSVKAEVPAAPPASPTPESPPKPEPTKPEPPKPPPTSSKGVHETLLSLDTPKAPQTKTTKIEVPKGMKIIPMGDKLEEPRDPVYESVRKKMEKTRVSLKELLGALASIGLPQPNATALEDVRVGPLKLADNDWQMILDELAMNPEL